MSLRKPKPTLVADVRKATHLLPPNDRRKLVLLVIAGIATSVMDLIGVTLIGLFTLLLVTVPTGGDPITGSNNPLIAILPEDWAGGMQVVLAIGAVAVLFLVGKSVVGMWLTRRTLRFLARRQAGVSERLTLQLFRQPIQVVERLSSQETVYALHRGVAAAVMGLLGSGSIAAAEISLLALLTLGLLVVSPGLTLAALAFFTGMAVFLHLVLGRWAGAAGLQDWKTSALIATSVQETLACYRELRVSARLDSYVSRWAPVYSDNSAALSTGFFLSQAPKYVYETALLLAVIGLAGWAFGTQEVSTAVATVAVFLAAGSRIMPSMLRLQNALVALRTAGGAAAPTFELHQRLLTLPSPPHAIHTHPVARPTATTGETFRSTVVLRDVVARFENADRPVLDQISLAVSAGSSVAIVGPTGSGKSSLVDVILGILEPQSGQVLVSGYAPSEAIQHFPTSIAYVPQNVGLVAGSVRQNIALGLPAADVDDDRIWEALAAVQLDEVLVHQRDGLDTIVGERGVSLSGGQRQRIGLARALLIQPQLLVLDEATSALDAQTEAAISGALQSLGRNATTITVAHRLATIVHSDLVIYLDEGRLVSQGPFDEVRRRIEDLDTAARLLGL